MMFALFVFGLFCNSVSCFWGFTEASSLVLSQSSFIFVWCKFTLRWFDVHHSKHQLIKKALFLCQWLSQIREKHRKYKYKLGTNHCDWHDFLCCWTKWSKRPQPQRWHHAALTHISCGICFLSHTCTVHRAARSFMSRWTKEQGQMMWYQAMMSPLSGRWYGHPQTDEVSLWQKPAVLTCGLKWMWNHRKDL